MKTRLFLGVSLLTLPLLTQAQYEGQAVRLDPARPKPGQTVTVTYNPAGTKLANAAAIDGIIYWLRPTGKPIAQGFTPARAGSTYQATLTIPDTVKSFALVFENGKVKDNNKDKTYAFLLYGPDGNVQPESYASLSRIYGLNYYYVGSEDRDPEASLQLMQKEIALNPKARRQFMTDYLFAFNSGNEVRLKELQKELDLCATLPDLTKDELRLLTYLYQNLGKKDQADAMTKQSEQKFGKPFDWDKVYEDFRNPALPLAQKKAKYETMKKEAVNETDPYVSQYIRYAYSIYLKALADSTRWTDFYGLIKEAPADFKPNTMGAYNAIAWDWAGKGKDLAKAEELSKQGTEWAKWHINAPREAIDPIYQTDKQLQKERLSAYGTYADTYGYILVKQGKVAQAFPYLKEAAAAKEWDNVEINERYVQALAQVDPAAVQKAVEPLIVTNKSSKGIEEAFKTAYTKTHMDDAGFDTYLARLRQKAIENQKTELREKLISYSAPAFSLMNLEGKIVSLADLKGKTVIVDFWATWCGPCIASFPGMQKAVEKFRSDPNIAFVFINCRQTETDKKKTAADFIAKKGYTFNVLLDENNEVCNKFGVTGIPTKFIIDKTGVIRFKSSGFMGNTNALADEISLMIDVANEPVN